MNILVIPFPGDDELGLWVLAGGAEDELVDEDVEELPESVGLMCTVDDEAIVQEGGLSSELTAKELGRIFSEALAELLKSGYKSYTQVAGLLRALATSSMFGKTVLIPFPRPSILVKSTGILYRWQNHQQQRLIPSITWRTHVELVVDIATDIDSRHIESRLEERHVSVYVDILRRGLRKVTPHD